MTMSDRGRIWLAGAAIVAAVFLGYANSFHGPFVFDDEPSILENATIRRLWPLSGPLSPPKDFGVTVSGRPVLNLSLALNYAIGGTEPWSYHGVNVGIHALAALVLFGVVRRTLRKPGLVERWGERAEATAGVTALLWALHPLQTESVTYVIQRAESLMGLFFLLTLYGFIRATESARPRCWVVVMVVSAVLGMGCKEVMATVPLVVFLYDRTFVAGSFRLAGRERWRWHGALLASWLPLGWLVLAAGGNRGGTFVLTWAGCRDYWLTQFGAVTHYLRLTVWPEPLVFDYGTFWVRTMGAVAVPAVVVLGGLGATGWALRRRPVVGFLLATFFVILAPTSVVPGTIQMIVEHRMYLPLAAVIALMVGAGVAWGGRVALMSFVGIAMVMGGLTWRRNRDYASDLRLWSDTVAKRPMSAIAQGNLGTAHYRRGRWAEAIGCYEEALRLGPVTAQMHYNLGLALDAAGRGEEAMAEYAEAVKILPYFAQAHTKRARLLIERGRSEEALEHLRVALSYIPESTEAHYAWGLAMSERGRFELAVTAFARVLKSEPGNAQAKLGLGMALMRVGRLAEARAMLEASVRENPKVAEVHGNLGIVLAELGRTEEAVRSYEAALRLQPDYAEMHYNLGNALVQLRRYPEARAQFAEAVRLRPEFAAAREMLARLAGF